MSLFTTRVQLNVFSNETIFIYEPKTRRNYLKKQKHNASNAIKDNVFIIYNIILSK